MNGKGSQRDSRRAAAFASRAAIGSAWPTLPLRQRQETSRPLAARHDTLSRRAAPEDDLLVLIPAEAGATFLKHDSAIASLGREPLRSNPTASLGAAILNAVLGLAEPAEARTLSPELLGVGMTMRQR
jgi:hypothetical protein